MLGSDHDGAIERDGEPSIRYVDHERTAAVCSSLSSETVMAAFRTVTERALTPSELAEGVDVSVQKASYHLSNIEPVGLVEVLNNSYSEKGREMDVYAVAAELTVLVLGRADDERVLRHAVGGITQAIGLPAVAVAALGTAARRLSNRVEQ